VMAALEALSSYAPGMMTGTGACVFARFERPDLAEAAWRDLSAAWKGFVAQGLQLSPVHAELHRLMATA